MPFVALLTFSARNQWEHADMSVNQELILRCPDPFDDAGELMWLRPEDIHPEDFGLLSVRRGVEKLLAAYKMQV